MRKEEDEDDEDDEDTNANLLRQYHQSLGFGKYSRIKAEVKPLSPASIIIFIFFIILKE